MLTYERRMEFLRNRIAGNLESSKSYLPHNYPLLGPSG